MWTSIELLKKSEDKVVYMFGIDELDGIMEIDLVNIDRSRIVCMPSNGLVDRRTANNAFGHMLNLSRRGEFPLKKTYATG